MDEITILKLEKPLEISTSLQFSSKIHFCINHEDILIISEDGIKFNKKHSALKTPDDFALEFINILQEKFDVRFIKKQQDLSNGFFPPPWNIYEFPEKTEGWIEFQKSLRKDPDYYLNEEK